MNARNMISVCVLLLAMPSLSTAAHAEEKERWLIPETLVPEGKEGHILKQLSLASRPATPTEEDRELETNDFDPTQTIKALIREQYQPSKNEWEHYAYKKRWRPIVTKQEVKESGGSDAIVMRYTTADYTLQTVESRTMFQIIIVPNRGELDLTVDEENNLPNILNKIMHPAALPDNDPRITREMKMANGQVANRLMWSSWEIEGQQGNPMAISICLSRQFICYGFSRVYRDSISYRTALRKPLFKQDLKEQK